MNQESNFYKPSENSKVVNYIEHNRFLQIYFLSLKLPSWEIINFNLMGYPISEQELKFVISKTRGGCGLRSYNKQIHNNQIAEQGGLLPYF